MLTCFPLGTAIAQTVVDFDNPAPSTGCGNGELVGVILDIDFAQQWSCWTNGSNNIAYDTQTGTSRTFTFTTPQVLDSLNFDSLTHQVADMTITISDGVNPDVQVLLQVGQVDLVVTTGWTQASTTVTIGFPESWGASMDDITYSPAGPVPDSSSGLSITITGAMQPTAMLTWNANSESDLAGYRVYRSTQSGVYTIGSPLAEVSDPVYIDNWLDPGTYFWVVTAFDTSNNESEVSNEVSQSVP